MAVRVATEEEPFPACFVVVRRLLGRKHGEPGMAVMPAGHQHRLGRHTGLGRMFGHSDLGLLLRPLLQLVEAIDSRQLIDHRFRIHVAALSCVFDRLTALLIGVLDGQFLLAGVGLDPLDQQVQLVAADLGTHVGQQHAGDAQPLGRVDPRQFLLHFRSALLHGRAADQCFGRVAADQSAGDPLQALGRILGEGVQGQPIRALQHVAVQQRRVLDGKRHRRLQPVHMLRRRHTAQERRLDPHQELVPVHHHTRLAVPWGQAAASGRIPTAATQPVPRLLGSDLDRLAGAGVHDHTNVRGFQHGQLLSYQAVVTFPSSIPLEFTIHRARVGVHDLSCPRWSSRFIVPALEFTIHRVFAPHSIRSSVNSGRSTPASIACCPLSAMSLRGNRQNNSALEFTTLGFRFVVFTHFSRSYPQRLNPLQQSNVSALTDRSIGLFP
jgi:hypothetical protein